MANTTFTMEWLNTDDIPKVDVTPPTSEPQEEQKVQEPEQELSVPTTVSQEEVVEEVVEELPKFIEELPQVDEDTKTVVHPKKELSLKELLNKTPEVTEEVNPEDTVKLTVPLSDPRTLTEELVAKAQTLGNANISEELNNPNSYIYGLRSAIDYFSNEVQIMRRILEKAAEDNKELIKTLQKTVEGVGVTNVKSKPEALPNKNLSGKDALIAVASLLQGVRTVPLWNSGFHITIKAPLLKDIINYYNTVNIEGYDFGRETGAFYFMYTDYRIKEHIVEELLYQCLVDSTYKHWKNKKKFLKALSIQDYDVIIWAIASMMYKSGVPIRIICSEPDCQHYKEITMDVTKLRYVDTSKLTPEAIKFMASHEPRNDKDIQIYTRKLLKHTTTYKFKAHNPATDIDTYWAFDIVPANLHDHLEYGRMIHTELLNENTHPTEEDVVKFFSINHYRSYLPWVESIHCITEEAYHKQEPLTENDYLLTINTQDSTNKDVIQTIMDTIQLNKADFREFITDYIERTKLTYISYYHPVCEKCGKPTTSSVQGFIPYDIQYHFFMMCLMRMLQTA